MTAFGRHSCGSFQVNGINGAANDYVLDAFLRVSQEGPPVILINCGLDAFRGWVEALRRALGLSPNAVGGLGQWNGFLWNGAKVFLEPDLAADTVRFYGLKENRDVLLAELTGWIWP